MTTVPGGLRLAALMGATAALLACTGAARADDAATFPSRNITLMVPFAAGGPPDAIARIVAAEMGKALGKPVVVENRAGASTSLAATAVARAAPDGHTLMAIDISFAVTPHIAANLGVDPLKDFKIVGQTAKSVFVLIASKSIGTPTVADFLKVAREKPEALKIAHTGVGTTPHLAAITFTNATGINPLLVPYRALNDAVSNMMAGHISAVFSAASTAIGLAPGGKVDLLGVTGDKRMAALPDLPTFAENGIAMTGFENGSWYGIAAPAGTPDAIVNKLNAAIRQMADNQPVKEKLAATGLELTSGTPEEFRAFVAAQYDYWGKALRAAGVKPQ